MKAVLCPSIVGDGKYQEIKNKKQAVRRNPLEVGGLPVMSVIILGKEK